MDQGILIAWNSTTEEKHALTNKNIYLNDWLVHASGDVFYTEGSSVFRCIRTTGEVIDYLDGSSSVVSFRFVDHNHILLNGRNINVNGIRRDGLYLFTLYGNEAGKIERLDNPFIDSYDVGSNVADFQQASNGIYYTSDAQNIITVYPGIPHYFALDITGLRQYKIIDLNLYALGQRDTKHVLLLSRLQDENAPAVDLLGDNNIEVYHFTVINEFIFFDGLLLSENRVIFGEINLNTRQLTQLAIMEKQFENLQPRKSVKNESFLAIDDIRELQNPPFITSFEEISAFGEIGNVVGIRRLSGEQDGYLAVLADREMLFFDIRNNPTSLSSSVEVLSPNDDLSYYNNDSFVQNGNYLFLASKLADSGTNRAMAVDISDMAADPVVDRNRSNPFVFYSKPLIADNHTFFWNRIGCDIVDISDPLHLILRNSITDSRSGLSYDCDTIFGGGVYGKYLDLAFGDVLPNQIHVLATSNLLGEKGLYNLAIDDSGTTITSFVPLDYETPSFSLVKGNTIYSEGYIYILDSGKLYTYSTNQDFSSVTPVFQRTIWTSGFDKMTISGSYAFSNSENQIYVVDIQDKAYPRLVQIIEVDAPINTIYPVENDIGDYTIYIGTDTGILLSHMALR